MPGLLEDLEHAIAGFGVPDPFHAIEGLKPLPPNRWDPVSIDGNHVGNVSKHDVGTVLPDKAWALWEWNDGADSLRLDATRGTKDVLVTLKDGTTDPRGRVQVKPIVVGLTAKISVRVHFIKGGTATEYRFDGKVS